ncbi:Cytidine deaminase [compost metagenome]
MAVVTDTPTPTAPCGACRQVLWEHAGDVPVLLANLTSVLGRHTMTDLLPVPFDRRSL